MVEIKISRSLLPLVGLLLRAVWPGDVQAAEAAPRVAVRFSAESVDANVAIGYGVVIGEVDGDGRPDILLADKSEFVWYENPGERGKAWPRHVMARNLTARDNVCLAARDLNGDGRVEVAVGANWNPGETGDVTKSGAVFYLCRPENPRELWTAVPIEPYEPTVHRMHWVRWDADEFRLLVLPLHGRENREGVGAPVRLVGYKLDIANGKVEDSTVVMEQMHMTHNFDVIAMDQAEGKSREGVWVGGREAIREVSAAEDRVLMDAVPDRGAGEVRLLHAMDRQRDVATIEPMHGTELVFYRQNAAGNWQRNVLDNSFQQGHALAAGDLLGLGSDQIVAGWRNPNAENRVGIRLYVPDASAQNWQRHTVDDNTMACEDLRLADLDGDGRLEIVAAGRATNNLMVYWNDGGS